MRRGRCAIPQPSSLRGQDLPGTRHGETILKGAGNAGQLERVAGIEPLEGETGGNRLWRADYSTARPHSQIAWQTPDEFAGTFAPRRSLALRNANGSAQAPAASPA